LTGQLSDRGHVPVGSPRFVARRAEDGTTKSLAGAQPLRFATIVSPSSVTASKVAMLKHFMPLALALMPLAAVVSAIVAVN